MAISDQDNPQQKGVPVRYIMAMMGSIGLAIVYGFKVNVSVAIVAMVNHTAIKLAAQQALDIKQETSIAMIQDDTCGHDAPSVQTPHVEDGPFLWDEPLQGLILSSYFWGYMISLLPGGRMAEVFSARWVMNASVLLNAAASLLTPIAARKHYVYFVAIRVIQGIGGGVSFPAIHVMVSKWAPPNERSVLASIAYAGTALGTVLSIFLSGTIAAHLGWIWVFYIEGLLCLIWCTAWWLMIEDSPEQQKRLISEEERQYIMNSLGQTENSYKIKPPVPWFQILKSPAFFAILVAHFCSNFGWYMILIELPTFMNKILKYDLKSNAWLSAMPFLCMWVFTMALSKLLAIMQDKTWISVTVSRKIGTLFSSAVPMFCLLAASYVGCNRAIAVALMTIGITCIGGMYCGFLANHIDIAPNFAGTLVAITNCIATIPGLIVPLFVGKLTHRNQTIEAWRVIFFLTATLYIIELFVYTMFGTGEEQQWNKVKSQDEEMPEQTVPLKEQQNRH